METTGTCKYRFKYHMWKYDCNNCVTVYHFQGFDVDHYFCHFFLLLFYNRIDVYFLWTCLDICLFVFFFRTGDYVTHNINWFLRWMRIGIGVRGRVTDMSDITLRVFIPVWGRVWTKRKTAITSTTNNWLKQ